MCPARMQELCNASYKGMDRHRKFTLSGKLYWCEISLPRMLKLSVCIFSAWRKPTVPGPGPFLVAMVGTLVCKTLSHAISTALTQYRRGKLHVTTTSLFIPHFTIEFQHSNYKLWFCYEYETKWNIWSQYPLWKKKCLPV